jgi:hypothetical protein
MSRLRLLTQIFSPRFRARRPSAILPGFWLLLTGCGPASQLVVPPWNQFHGDVANSGQVLTGTKPAKELGVVSGQVGRMEFSSPVLARMAASGSERSDPAEEPTRAHWSGCPWAPV